MHFELSQIFRFCDLSQFLGPRLPINIVKQGNKLSISQSQISFTQVQWFSVCNSYFHHNVETRRYR